MMPHASSVAAQALRSAGDPPDPDELFRAHTGLVRKIAWQIRSGTSSMIEAGDLIQIGLIALLEASRGFEDRGLPFAPYAATRVRGAMIDALRKQSSDSRGAASARRLLRDTRASLEQEHCRSIGDAEMAASLGLGADRYHALVASSIGPQNQSLDDAYSEYDLAFADSSDAANPDYEAVELKQALAGHVAELPDREATVLQLYFVEELNLTEIGLVLNVGAARVCQIKRSALHRLRSKMAKWQPETVDILD